jgi:hypothetical protein
MAEHHEANLQLIGFVFPEEDESGKKPAKRGKCPTGIAMMIAAFFTF